MVDQKMLGDLESTLARIRGHFLYSDELNDQALATLNHDAISHSDQLEVDTSSQETLLKLRGAWETSIGNFQGTIDKGVILDVARQIDPNLNTYRRTAAQVSGKVRTHVMTNPEKIDREMEKLFIHINDTDIHPVQRATDLHLYFAIIHPLADGNGRTSRLLQNVLLYHYGIPPATIRHAERPTYLDHIEDATIGFKERSGQDNMFEGQSHQELRFLRYVQGKVNDNAEWLEKKMAALKRYQVDIDLKGPHNTILGIRNVLRQALRAQGLTPVIKVDKCEGKLEVVTEHPKEFVVGMLENYKRNHNHVKGYTVTDTTYVR